MDNLSFFSEQGWLAVNKHPNHAAAVTLLNDTTNYLPSIINIIGLTGEWKHPEYQSKLIKKFGNPHRYKYTIVMNRRSWQSRAMTRIGLESEYITVSDAFLIRADNNARDSPSAQAI